MGDICGDSLELDYSIVDSFTSAIFKEADRRMIEKTFQIAKEKASRKIAKVFTHIFHRFAPAPMHKTHIL